MITDLSVENFKAWERIPSMDFAPITGLFGTNSSGKTSLLQLLLLLKQTVESTDRAQVLNFGDPKSLVNLGGLGDVLYEHDLSRPLRFGFTWEREMALQVPNPATKREVLFEDASPHFQARIVGDVASQPRVAEMAYQMAGRRFSLASQEGSTTKYKLLARGQGFRFVRQPGRVWPLPAPVKFYGFPDEVRAYYQNAGFLADLELALESLFTETYYLGPLREHPLREYTWSGAQPSGVGTRGERAVDALLASRARNIKFSPGYKKRRVTLEEYTAHWLKALGLIESFSVAQLAEGSNLYQVRVRTSSSAPEVLITDVGFGVSQILPIVVLCFSVPEKSILVLEQPEIHLHPSVQAGLADVFIDAVKVRKVQIIFESHSEHLLLRLQRRIAEEEIEAAATALFFCRRDEPAARIERLEVDAVGNIANWPRDFFGDPLHENAEMLRAQMKRASSA